MISLCYILGGSIGALFFLYIAARVVTRAILRTINERKKNG